MKHSRSILVTLIALALSGCGLPFTPEPMASTSLPTPRLEDIQTALAGTALALATPTFPPAPTVTPSLPTPIAPSATAPSVPATASPPSGISEERPAEAILILEPGFGSQVTSPVRVAGMADPTFEQNLVVQVMDENGNTLIQLPTIIGADLGQRGPFAVEAAFEVAADQPGRIVVFAESPRDGGAPAPGAGTGVVHLASVEVTLLALGTASLALPQDRPEEIVVFAPAPNTSISGGTVHVSGLAGPTFEQNIIIQILDANGAVVGSAPTTIAADLGFSGEFAADIHYAIASEQPGRIIIFHDSARDGGLLHLASVEVNLSP